ncbi:MAG: DUF4373 domain-containing protein [Bacteroidetes bacterium]|nr:DUF4373 domain-containing protein [Bacteroidota bacterium]
MARPERNSVDYFPFLCEEGNKMFYLEETYGNDGFATFVKLLRELGKTDYHYLNLSKPSTLMYLSAKCKVSKEVLESIINDLVDLGKFDAILWRENKIIWCQDFIDSIQDAYKKRNNKCITLEGLFTLLTSLGIRKQGLLPTIGPINTQSKVKKSKVKESKENYNARKLKFSTTLTPFLEMYGKEFLNEFYKYWTEPNKSQTKFRQELEPTWDLERRLQTWAKNDKNFSNKKTAPVSEMNQTVIDKIKQYD